MEFLKIFDAYSLRARLFPAVIAAAPALASLALLISWSSFAPSNVIATAAVLVLLFAMADLARARGRAVERKLEAESGKPSIVMFRRSDSTIDDKLKDRYRDFLAGKLAVLGPSPAAERRDQPRADSFYEQCGVWLRTNTRDSKKFSLLFNENVTYGYRRNLFGVKWFALALNLLVVVICLSLLWRANWSWETDFGARTLVVLLIAAIHAVYILVAVRKSGVVDASRAYARELIMSCEAFLSAPHSTTKKPASRKRGSLTPK